VLLIVLISASSLPKVTSDDKIEKSFSALRYPQLVLGMLAIFIYVGTEVTIQSNLGALVKTADFGNMEDAHIAPYISLYWGSLMIGRWNGSLSVFNLKESNRKLLSIVVPFIAFGIILIVNKMYGKDVQELFIYAIWIVVFILASFWSAQKPAKTLVVFGLAAVAMMLVGLCTRGQVALFSFISGGLFCSVMWPCIFNLAIAGLGKYTNQGSSLLIMMIFGGALIPPLQGHLCDMDKANPGGILGTSFTHFSYIVPVAGFLYLAWYGYKVKGILKSQGIDYESTAAGSGH
jgi:FHS family L-fucose permease-like MFS transporter